MATFLLTRLYGPLCAWGGPAVGELRPTGDHPTRSALLGLLGACLGVRRDDAQEQAVLVEGFGVAVRVDAAGRRMEDYHTIQAPKARKGVDPVTRREELANPDHLETMITRRGYVQDAVYSVAWWGRGTPPWGLDTAAEALTQPRFTPYLGRKSCPPALPLVPVLSDGPTLVEAFADLDAYLVAAWGGHEGGDPLAGLLDTGPRPVVWDLDPPGGDPVAVQSLNHRRDAPADRGRWQFEERVEKAGLLGGAE
jgi:CRISPR system Cascade subunit CasD